jgi:hypothetical protein
MLYDLSDGDTATISDTEDFFITGSNPAEPVPEQPFVAEDIAIITDGFCASTCSIFVGLMVREQGVRTIALGGRPITRAMQAIGGTKGTHILNFRALQLMSNLTAKHLPGVEADVILPLRRKPLRARLSLSQININFRNAYAQNATDGPPLQFVYEAANCRRFYRQEYLTDITALWRDMADIAWHAAQCAPGSTVNSDGTIGNGVLGFDEAVVSKAKPYTGPGSLTEEKWKALAWNMTDQFGRSLVGL